MRNKKTLSQKLLKTKDWNRTTEKIIGTKEISETDFSSGSCTSTEKNHQLVVLKKQDIKVKILFALISWMAYYNNNCYIHYSKKDGSG